MSLLAADLLDDLAALPGHIRFQAPPRLRVQEHPATSFGAVTCANADVAASFAYGFDFTTEQQRLAYEIAGARMLQVPLGTPHHETARLLLEHLRRLDADTLNVTGNTLCDLARSFRNVPAADLQGRVEDYLVRVLRLVATRHPLLCLRSGADSGVEAAAISAALAVKVPALALLPKGCAYHDASGAIQRPGVAAAVRRLTVRPRTVPVI